MPDHAEPAALRDVALLLRDGDDVAVATQDLAEGRTLRHADGELTVAGPVPRSHKIALRDLAAGAQIHKYGQVIGRATVAIRAGEHVHAHNLGMDAVEHDYEFGT